MSAITTEPMVTDKVDGLRELLALDCTCCGVRPVPDTWRHADTCGLFRYAQADLGENPKDRVGVKKPQLNLVPASSLIYQALAMDNGATKYGPYNWRGRKVKASIYVASALRHLLSWQDGEELADDSQIPHLAHALACIGIIVDAKESGCLVDDRPVPGPAAALIARYTKAA